MWFNKGIQYHVYAGTCSGFGKRGSNQKFLLKNS